MPTILITGASTGMGHHAAEFFAANGWNVAATMRTPEKYKEDMETNQIKCFRLDVTDLDSIAKTIRDTVECFGGLDVVVNNAGYGIIGPMEGASVSQIDRQISTNLAGPIHIMSAALPLFRAQKSGIFINVTSVGGRVTMPVSYTHLTLPTILLV